MAAISHHTVPEFYLKKFRGPSRAGYKVWQYEKGSEPRPVPSVRAAAIDHYSTVLLSATGSFDSDIVEAALSRHESDAARLFRKIESRDFGASDKADFAKWMSIQMTRVPCFREWILEGVRRDCQIEVSPAYALAHLEDRHFDLISGLDWGFLEAPGQLNFVTSDNPVYLCGAGLVYPLNTKLVLVAGELEREGLTDAEPELVDMVNLTTLKGAYKYIYASENIGTLNTRVQQCLGLDNMRPWRHTP